MRNPGDGFRPYFWLILVVGFIFQSLIAGEFGSNATVTPDSREYLGLASDIQEFLHGEKASVGHYVRTPGYPLFLVAAAELSRVRLKEAEMPIRDWEATNAVGREFLRTVIILQQLVGALIPVLIYLLAFTLVRSGGISLLCALVYLYDVPTVCYEFVVLSETLSIFLLLLSMLVLVRLSTRHSPWGAAACGLLVGAAAMMKPTILVGAPAGAIFVALVSRGTAAKRVMVVMSFVVAASLAPSVWIVANGVHFGHFFLSKNLTVTLQNYSAEHFVAMELDDPELVILQRHTEAALIGSPNFAMTRNMHPAMAELGNKDRYEYLQLVGRANAVTVRAHWREFARSAWDRYLFIWRGELVDVKNRYAISRLQHLLGEKGEFRTRLLLAPNTLYACTILLCALVVIVPDARARWSIAILYAFINAYILVAAAPDEMEVARHGMVVRPIINAMVVGGVGFLCLRIYGFIAGRGPVRMQVGGGGE